MVSGRSMAGLIWTQTAMGFLFSNKPSKMRMRNEARKLHFRCPSNCLNRFLTLLSCPAEIPSFVRSCWNNNCKNDSGNQFLHNSMSYCWYLLVISPLYTQQKQSDFIAIGHTFFSHHLKGEETNRLLFVFTY